MATIERARRHGKRYLNPVPTVVGTGSSLMKAMWLYWTTSRKGRTPLQKPGPFLTDVRLYDTTPSSGLRVTWMGHSTSLVEIDGARVIIDPVWDQRAGPVNWLGPKRFFDPALALEQLPRIDVVLLSHDHYDHLGKKTVQRLARLANLSGARWVTTLGVGRILARFGVPADRITELDWTESVQVGPLNLLALPARHFSGRGVLNRFQTLWASFVLAGPAHRVFYGADSGEWDGFASIAGQHGPFDLTMLEIGASNPLWADIHMGPEGAVRTVTAMDRAAANRAATPCANTDREAANRADSEVPAGPQSLLMPIHWGLFDLAIHPWRQPIEYLFAQPGLKLWSPEPGLPTEVLPGVEVRSGWWRDQP